ncbi:sulfate adenylyltransferase [Adhaeribacter soli]|uniref:sulfate adenylyltransferase n=2 Tax=Adhaeribacter soli TaxID=2607655 RepID=A0A5N1IR59_9BACT|nr:sulfate adenylyltransferase [Adhaeribacter soli]
MPEGKKTNLLSTETPTDVLRFLAAGNVDDGKSTLIGRLLYDSRAVMKDQLEAVTRASQNKGKDFLDLSFLTDGLQAEREQGITIDVAYRYFSTPKRKFIVADTPGHWEYTRNMVTGASNADLMLILVDARNGLTEQTYRHTLLASLLGFKHLILCVNKMDTVGFKEAVFEDLVAAFKVFTATLNIPSISCVPVSALKGDNVVQPSASMPWYKDKTLLEQLEEVNVAAELEQLPFRFPVQLVLPVQDNVVLAGQVESGRIKVGDKVQVHPGGEERTVLKIQLMDQTLEEAVATNSVSLVLDEGKPLQRGNLLSATGDLPLISDKIKVEVCWFGPGKLLVGQPLLVKHTTRFVKAEVLEIVHKTDVATLKQMPAQNGLEMNEIGEVLLQTEEPLYYGPYLVNKGTGSLIFICPRSFETIGAGLIR